jgi:hypothetical protein
MRKRAGRKEYKEKDREDGGRMVPPPHYLFFPVILSSTSLPLSFFRLHPLY